MTTLALGYVSSALGFIKVICIPKTEKKNYQGPLVNITSLQIIGRYLLEFVSQELTCLSMNGLLERLTDQVSTFTFTQTARRRSSSHR